MWKEQKKNDQSKALAGILPQWVKNAHKHKTPL